MAATPSLTWELKLTEDQIKDALAEWVNTKYGVNATPKDISFRVRGASYGSMDQRENYPAGVEQASISITGNPFGAQPKTGGKGM